MGSPSNVCQPLDCIVVCRVESGQTAIQLRQRAWVDSVRHRLGLGHRSTGPACIESGRRDLFLRGRIEVVRWDYIFHQVRVSKKHHNIMVCYILWWRDVIGDVGFCACAAKLLFRSSKSSRVEDVFDLLATTSRQSAPVCLRGFWIWGVNLHWHSKFLGSISIR